jgi:adhesin HecA-like repeat protein
VVIDPGTSSEEKCSATISGSTLTLTRGQDDTTAVSHSSGATIYPVFSADDADEVNNMASTMTTKGDLLVTTGSAFNRLPVGTDTHVLTADSSAANGVAWAVAASPVTFDDDQNIMAIQVFS